MNLGVHYQSQDWISSMDKNRQRWFTFLDKLEQRMQELGESAIPELKETARQDTDIFRRGYGTLLAAIKGQYEQIRRKADEVKEEKVMTLYDACRQQVAFDSPQYDLLFRFREDCLQRQDAFEKNYHDWLERLEATGEEDLELRYQAILDEYEKIKNKFTCVQCGSYISIPKLFFISTYIACPHCQTQNRFEPGSGARQLEHLGRDLAAQRTKHLLEAYKSAGTRERELYMQAHQLKLSLIHENHKTTVQQKQAQLKALDEERHQLISRTPALYEQYLRAMFDEWNKIVPDLREQNEKFYRAQLAAFRERQ